MYKYFYKTKRNREGNIFIVLFKQYKCRIYFYDNYIMKAMIFKLCIPQLISHQLSSSLKLKALNLALKSRYNIYMATLPFHFPISFKTKSTTPNMLLSVRDCDKRVANVREIKQIKCDTRQHVPNGNNSHTTLQHTHTHTQSSHIA